jgi:hypothetical protein
LSDKKKKKKMMMMKKKGKKERKKERKRAERRRKRSKSARFVPCDSSQVVDEDLHDGAAGVVQIDGWNANQHLPELSGIGEQVSQLHKPLLVLRGE